ncbi:4-(cytidine 5'-diphospho)-2-C-methyl-D-erythritol kinase [Aureliella helgolandensis]|uniref:4-diphosphocytidyl-2-C-methyl-D-erythritol kinase n=1 Tax=Aureliella helgolandensis TaxID=2527968 RepID=A0A518G8A1_9BACT|nr:4-(cytidine 5'-diphospho)-2-C-methyl-D-erythritol kinase [Aureliella helgolandensis]QDV24822.1 4-diphosphocytidyl-2-C-methyl-D-erythritol kinase [Aureliella helgolandensis]
MLIQCSGSTIEIFAPAKVNLFLEVLGRREDGFHEIETVMCPISLYDRLLLEPTQSKAIALAVHHPSEAPESSEVSDPAWNIPSDHRNLVVRAVEEVQLHLGTTQGAKITLHKQIPAAAGLGGGSSDAAAAVVASLLAWGQWDRSLAYAICAKLGSDIPFFLGDACRCGLALATGRGERCEFLPYQPSLNLLITHPPQGCDTAAIYAHYAAQQTLSQTAPASSSQMLTACAKGDQEMIGAALSNALQSSAVCLNGWIDRQLDLFRNCQVQYGLMSGSGSSCFALIDDRLQQQTLRERALKLVPRVYSATACYHASVEQQLLDLRS